MAEVIIDGKKVKYDGGSHSMKKIVNYLQTRDHSEIRPFFDETHRPDADGRTHLKITDHEDGRDHHATLVREGDTYRLRHRTGY